MHPPLVLHFLGYDEDRGGVLTAIRRVAAEPGLEHRLVVNPGFAQRREPGLPVRLGPPVAAETIAPGELWATLRAALALLPEAQAGRAIVHGHSRAGTLVGWWLWLLGQGAVVVSPHCYGRQRWFYRWIGLCLGERCVWLSPAMKRYYGTGSAGWAGCIPEPAPPPSPRPTSRRRAPGHVITLGGAGTLTPWKGWHLVLEAMARLSPAERARFRFVHIGDADGSSESAAYHAELQRITAQLGLSGQVEWRGWQPDSSGLLAEIDILLVPSVNEPMSLAGLEALAAGVPLLVADSGGLSDVIRPGVNALVFRTGRADDLADRLRALAGTDFLARVAITSADLTLVATGQVAAAWRQRYAATDRDSSHVL